MKSEQIRIAISPELKKDFKNLCEKNSQNMSKVILKFIKEQIEKGDK
jgi:predicted DNA-binding protein